MDDVARLPIADRTELFVATARRRALTATIIEKDFWVCWTLKRIFTLPDPPAGLLISRAARRSPRCSASSSGFPKTWTYPSTAPGTRKCFSRRPGHATPRPSRARSDSCRRTPACRNWSRTTAICGR